MNPTCERGEVGRTGNPRTEGFAAFRGYERLRLPLGRLHGLVLGCRICCAGDKSGLALPGRGGSSVA